MWTKCTLALSSSTVGGRSVDASTDRRPTVNRPVGRLSTDSRSTIDRLSADQESTDRRPTRRPTVDRLVIRKYTDSRSTVDRLWPTVGRQSADASTDGRSIRRPMHRSTVDRLRAKVHLVQLCTIPQTQS